MLFKIAKKVDSEKDKKKFLKNLFFYRSLLFKTVLFEIDTDDEEIKDIETALNIKKKRDRITYIYDKAIEKIENFYDGEDICEFKCKRCLAHRELEKDTINGCCRWCFYQSEEGCPTKNLACKLFNCDSVRKKHDCIEMEDIKILQVLTIRERNLLKSDYFSKREDVISDLTLGIFLGTIKMYARLVVNTIKMIF